MSVDPDLQIISVDPDLQIIAVDPDLQIISEDPDLQIISVEHLQLAALTFIRSISNQSCDTLLLCFLNIHQIFGLWGKLVTEFVIINRE